MFGVTNELLKEDLDRLVKMYRMSHPDFYNQYRAARIIHDIGGGHSSKNGEPEEDAVAETAETTGTDN